MDLTEPNIALLKCRMFYRNAEQDGRIEDGKSLIFMKLERAFQMSVMKLILINYFLNNRLGNYETHVNRSQLKNPDISGTIYTLRIQYSFTQTQCEDGARDVRVL